MNAKNVLAIGALAMFAYSLGKGVAKQKMIDDCIDYDALKNDTTDSDAEPEKVTAEAHPNYKDITLGDVQNFILKTLSKK